VPRLDDVKCNLFCVYFQSGRDRWVRESSLDSAWVLGVQKRIARLPEGISQTVKCMTRHRVRETQSLRYITPTCQKRVESSKVASMRALLCQPTVYVSLLHSLATNQVIIDSFHVFIDPDEVSSRMYYIHLWRGGEGR
jgi:hypothetical protein